MNQSQEHHHIVDILFVLALFGVFAVSALVLVTIGAGVYQNTVQDMGSNFDSRTAMAYLTEKIRQNDGADSVSIGTLENTDALLLSQDIDGETYITYLYYHDGTLRELFIKEGADLVGNPLSAGQEVMPLTSLKLEKVSDSLYSFEMATADGEVKKLLLSTRSR